MTLKLVALDHLTVNIDASSRENFCEYPHIARNCSHWRTLLLLTV